METRKVFVVGDSLFAEALTQILAKTAVEIVGSAPTPEAALPRLKTKCPDAVIIANASAEPTLPAVFGQFLAAYPNLPIICANLGANDIQVITSQRAGTGSSDLLAAIAALPKRS
ncbi:MAG: hypothetical protein HYZ49_20635 [Chloroflexi bacterium]|nr:hypothetical protein [Chloroflexota bacterium]